MLNIGLGHTRLFYTDLNLLTQIITLLIIFVSIYYKNKGKVKNHGTIMGIALVLHVLSFALVMGPIFVQSLSIFLTQTSFLWIQTTWLHVIPGVLSLALAIFLVAKWAVKPSNVAGCYKRKRLMDLTLVLWIFSLTLGIVTYILFYL